MNWNTRALLRLSKTGPVSQDQDPTNIFSDVGNSSWNFEPGCDANRLGTGPGWSAASPEVSGSVTNLRWSPGRNRSCYTGASEGLIPSLCLCKHSAKCSPENHTCSYVPLQRSRLESDGPICSDAELISSSETALCSIATLAEGRWAISLSRRDNGLPRVTREATWTADLWRVWRLCALHINSKCGWPGSTVSLQMSVCCLLTLHAGCEKFSKVAWHAELFGFAPQEDRFPFGREKKSCKHHPRNVFFADFALGRFITILQSVRSYVADVVVIDT